LSIDLSIEVPFAGTSLFVLDTEDRKTTKELLKLIS